MKKYWMSKFMIIIMVLSIGLVPVACGSDDSGPDPGVTKEDSKADPTNSNTTIEATSSVAADGMATATVTVTLADAAGKKLTASGGTVALSATGDASISAVTDNDDGTYAATVTNGTAETVTISGTVGSTAITNTAEIVFNAVSETQADLNGSTIASTSPVVADGTATAMITVTLVDGDGAALTSSGGMVALTATGDAVVSEVTDNGDGTYSATVTNMTAETVTISGTLGGEALSNTAEIVFEAESTDSVVIAINAGGDEVMTAGGTFMMDEFFTLPSEPFSNTEITDIMGTEDDDLYLTERYPDEPLGSFGYEIPVDNGTYEVKLHFAELFWGLENQGGVAGGAGSRVFDVTIEDELALDDYDIFDEVGAATADIKVFETVVEDGILNIQLSASVDQPKISAIEVIIK